MLRRLSIKLLAEGSSAGLMPTVSARTAGEIDALGRCMRQCDYQMHNQYFQRFERWFGGGIPGRSFATGRKVGVHQHQQAKKRASEQGLYLVGGDGASGDDMINKIKKKVQRIVNLLPQVTLVVGMVGLTYASVPLYRMFCQATGFGGTIKEGRSVEEKLKARKEERNEELEMAAAKRELTITFSANVADGLEWKFVPTQRAVKVHPGQSTLAFYTVENLSKRSITGVSTYNVAPQQVGQYFNKVQCFCFEEQRLRPGEKIDMPVFFYIDPEYATDPRVDNINNITLSYTFFKVGEDDED